MTSLDNVKIWALATFACCAGACVHVGGQGSLIGKYRAASCVAQAATRKVIPRSREWDTTISFPNGTAVVVRGADIPGGIIALFYPRTGDTVVVANAGDYIYPTDVRVNLRDGLLYVRAHGVTWSGAEQTWLFQYDVQRRRLLRRVKVDDAALPPECERPG